MPVTPFHFGPGALLKALAPQRVSLTAFCASQVAIDLESGYHLLRSEWPVHREFHSLVLASLLGVLAGAVVTVVGKRLSSSLEPPIRSEIGTAPALVGGLLGGVSHPLLDGIMHPDLRPFWPVSDVNPVLGLVDLTSLHLLCVVSGIAGLLLLGIRARA